MGAKRLDYLQDYLTHGFDVEVTCLDCGRCVIFSARELIAYFTARQWIGSIENVRQHMVCKGKRGGIEGCGSRRARIRATDRPPTPPDPEPPVPSPWAERVPLGVDAGEWASSRGQYERKCLIRRARG
jgi:hypothetical protein